MTCIVGLVAKDRVWMGVDSYGSTSWVGYDRSDMKMFVPQGVKNSLISYTTSYRMGQILMYEDHLFDELSVLKKEIDHKYMVTKFIPKVQTAFNTGGFGKDDSGTKIGGCFLVAYKDLLFSIESDYQVGINSVGYAADGCGQEFALGSLSTTQDLDMRPRDRVLAALRAAAHFSPGVAGPFHVADTKTCNFQTFEA